MILPLLWLCASVTVTSVVIVMYECCCCVGVGTVGVIAIVVDDVVVFGIPLC